MHDLNSFLVLPDWKKMSLKRTVKKFNNYPVMTEMQREYREKFLTILCAHFSMVDEYDGHWIYNDFYSY
jgi:hypothetical protein